MNHGPRVLVAGATGAVGARVTRMLIDQGCFVRTLSRDVGRAAALRASEVVIADAMDRASLHTALEGIDVVVSCLGANVSLRLRERRSYSALDPVANGNVLEAARAAGSKRFVYVGVHTAPGYDTTRYCVAHERFVERLRAADVSSTVVRPTGIFTALDDLLVMARFGMGSIVGDGTARTNPIHPDDVARAVVASLHEGPRDLAIGGPDVLTRAEVLKTAFDALGKRMRAVHVPPWVFRVQSALLGPVHPRLAELFEFVAAVSTHDGIAPVYGQKRLADWFAAPR